MRAERLEWMNKPHGSMSERLSSMNKPLRSMNQRLYPENEPLSSNHGRVGGRRDTLGRMKRATLLLVMTTALACGQQAARAPDDQPLPAPSGKASSDPPAATGPTASDDAPPDDPVIASMVDCPDQAMISAADARSKKVTPKLKVGIENLSVVPSVDDLPAFYRAFSAASDKYVACYAPALKANPKARGLVGVALRVATDGSIREARACPNAQVEQSVVDCVVDVDKKLQLAPQKAALRVMQVLHFGTSLY